MSGVDRILYDNFVNYFYPQYVLPWNNFYGRIDSIPYYTRTVLNNQQDQIEKAGIRYDSQANLQTQEGETPDLALAISSRSIGTLLQQESKKFFNSKVYSFSDGALNVSGLSYSYDLSGTIINANCGCGEEGDNWIVMVFNLYSSQNNRKQKVLLVGSQKTPALEGTIEYGRKTVTIVKPKTMDDFDPMTGNTIYSLAGNRLVVAIWLGEDVITPADSTVNFTVKATVAETFTAAEILDY